VVALLASGLLLLAGGCLPGRLDAPPPTTTPESGSTEISAPGQPTAETYPTVPAVSANTLADDEVARVFRTALGGRELTLRVNVTPPGAAGADVRAVSIVARDEGQTLGSLDDAAKRALGVALLDAAAAAWPQASVTLLAAASDGSGQILGNRPSAGPASVFVS
jgi:hypothetical protein